MLNLLIIILNIFLVTCDYQNQTDYKNNDKVIVAYYSDWTAAAYPPEKMEFSKITHINYAFAIVDEKHDIKLESKDLLKKLAKLAHQNNVKVLLSIGGWTGSKYFSSLVKGKVSRTKFITKAMDMVKEFDLDGIDIDWEYPGTMGISCNQVNYKWDTPNFLNLLKETRLALDTKLLTLAVATHTFDINKRHSKNLKGLASSIDFINIMAYDINSGSPSTIGPNAPLNFENKGKPQSYMQSIRDWNKAGIPKDKLVMGLAFYGKSRKLKSKFNPSKGLYQLGEPVIPKGDEDDAPWADPCPGAQKVFSGVWKWSKLRSQKVLITPDQSGLEWKRYWDKVSQTPYLYNSQNGTLISYDDLKSLGIKAEVVNQMGLKGVMFWSANMDNGELLDSIQTVRK